MYIVFVTALKKIKIKYKKNDSNCLDYFHIKIVKEQSILKKKKKEKRSHDIMFF